MSRKTRKLIWSAPLVAVLAVAGVLALFVALEPGSVFANPLPAAPTDLVVEPAMGDAGRTSLVLNWNPPPATSPATASIRQTTVGSYGKPWWAQTTPT